MGGWLLNPIYEPVVRQTAEEAHLALVAEKFCEPKLYYQKPVWLFLDSNKWPFSLDSYLQCALELTLCSVPASLPSQVLLPVLNFMIS